MKSFWVLKGLKILVLMAFFIVLMKMKIQPARLLSLDFILESVERLPIKTANYRNCLKRSVWSIWYSKPIPLISRRFHTGASGTKAAIGEPGTRPEGTLCRKLHP